MSLKKLNPKNKQEIKTLLERNGRNRDYYDSSSVMEVTDPNTPFQIEYWDWWIKDGEVHRYGCGPGWRDQDSIIRDGEDIEKYLSLLWKVRKHLYTYEPWAF